MEADWDLHAVVRGFATSYVPSSNGDFNREKEVQKRDGFCSKNLVKELHELFTPYLLNPQQTGGSVQPTISSYFAALEASKHKITHQIHKGNQLTTNNVPITLTTASVAAPNSQTSQKPKKRKFQLKKISHVPSQALSSDIWAWRKYGQKPIKGSPYPRGYYKCSSSKQCIARKQVERNRSDPTKFIVTCTGVHNHPAPTHKNSLAGTTRNPNPFLSTSHDDSILPISKLSSSSSMENMSPTGPLDDEVLQHNNGNGMEINTDDMKGDMSRTYSVSELLGFLDMDVTDDPFDGLDEIPVTPMDSYFPDPFLPSFPNLGNNVWTKGDRN